MLGLLLQLDKRARLGAVRGAAPEQTHSHFRFMSQVDLSKGCDRPCVYVCVCVCVCARLTCALCPASLHHCYYCTRCSCAAHRRNTAAFTNHTCPLFWCLILILIFSGRNFELQWSLDEDHSVSARWNDGESKLYSFCFSVSLFCQVSSNILCIYL